MNARMSKGKKIGFGAVLLLLLLIGAALLWLMTAAQPMPEALRALESGADVAVEQEPWLVFRPAEGQPETGLIFYPGGRVDYRAYAPFARAVAEQGILVVIPQMPFNLAVFDPAEAGPVMDAYPNVQRWVVGGHSLGGAMAANFAKANPGRVRGLLLIASYPAESDSLVDSNLPVLSISGSEDGLADSETVDASRALLPEDAVFLVVEGGNHAQFGWYGEQSGDNPARISRDEQMEQTISATIKFLQSIP